MTARWRAWWAAGAALLVCGALPSYDGPLAVAAESPTPSASASTTAPDRAGSRPGEGRVRPGRSVPVVDEPTEEEEGDEAEAGEEAGGEDPAALDPSPATTHTPDSASHATEPAARVLRIVPLGSGLILIGLGLGLAFLALRLRRG